MRILIAPDKFKGALNAREVAENIAEGLRDALPDAKIEIVPMADGGEGTAEAICEARGGSWMKCKAHDPIGREIEARYGWIEDGKLAVMEMSEAAGMRRLTENERDPVHATTFGVGEMISDAANRGANEIIIGLGGSATNDGGWGMARALGYRFFSDGKELTDGVSELAKLTNIISPKKVIGALAAASAQPKDRRLTQPPLQSAVTKIIAAVDVRNPLLGENGATRVFGAQKGASKAELNILEQALTRLADVVAKEFDFDYRDKPGPAAPGGLGFGLMSSAGRRFGPFRCRHRRPSLSQNEEADAVVTGEGSLDWQTLEGKTPAALREWRANLARKFSRLPGATTETHRCANCLMGFINSLSLARARRNR
jgi:glycerate kinase